MTFGLGGAIIDAGNVVIAHWLSGTTPENFHRISYNSIPEAPGSFEGIAKLNRAFEGNVTIAYKATDTATTKIMGWFESHKFRRRTKVPHERIKRIPESNDPECRDKTPFLWQKSGRFRGATVVIDDRLQVLSHFIHIVPHCFLYRPQADEVLKFQHTGALKHVQMVKSWDEIMKTLKL